MQALQDREDAQPVRKLRRVRGTIPARPPDRERHRKDADPGQPRSDSSTHSLSDDESRNLDRLNSRLQLIRDRTTAVAEGWSTGLYLFGEGGIGKSYTVLEQLDRLKVPHKVTNSRLTGKGLFELLEDHPDTIHVLEDMESLCKSSNAAGVLRSALWTATKDKGKGRQERLITWRVGGEKRMVSFTGGIIMTMNAPLDDLPELRAVKTRIAVAKLEPTNAKIAALMKSICLRGYKTKGLRT